MRGHSVFLALVTAAMLVGPVQAPAQTRGLTIELKTSEARDAPVAEKVQLYASSQALVIGIDKYTNGWPRLSKAVEDARAVAAELESKGFNVTLKTDVSSSELKAAFEEFFITKGADPTARLFVWYAGHGYSEDDEGFLIPADAPLPEAGTQFRFKALPMRRFGEYVRLARSKHAYAVFDACFAGTIFTMQRSRPPAAITRATAKPVRQFLTSGDAGQKVSDDGTFRELFVRALRGEERADANGDGYVTATEMGLFLDDRVTNLTEARQTPRYGKLRDKDYDLGDFVFALAAPPPPQTTTPTSATAPPTGMTADMMFWQSMKDSTNSEDLQDYLDRFPNGQFTGLAKRRLATLTPPKKKSVLHTLNPLLVNLKSDGKGNRYVKLTVVLELVGEAQLAMLESRMPFLREDFIFHLSEQTEELFVGSESLIRLRKELLALANKNLGLGAVRSIAFKEFLVQ